jgi:hypothetical protein
MYSSIFFFSSSYSSGPSMAVEDEAGQLDLDIEAATRLWR